MTTLSLPACFSLCLLLLLLYGCGACCRCCRSLACPVRPFSVQFVGPGDAGRCAVSCFCANSPLSLSSGLLFRHDKRLG